MVIFNSYVKLPEGILRTLWPLNYEWCWDNDDTFLDSGRSHIFQTHPAFVCRPKAEALEDAKKRLEVLKDFRHGTGKNQHISGWFSSI